MIETHAKIRKWGNSLGIVLPSKAVEQEHLKEGDEIEIKIFKKTNVLKETFGAVKFKQSTQELLDEIDKEAWDD